MGSKVCLKKNFDVLEYIYSISNDVMINNLIFDLINRDGVTNFFYNDDGSYSFSLINDKHEKVYILFNDEHIFVSNNLDGIRQQIYYQVNDDGKYLSINNFSSIISHDNCIDRTVKFEKMYDCYDNLVYERKVIDTKDSSNDCYDNSCSIITKYFIDDSFVRVNSVCYDSNPDMNKINYYVYDGSSWVSIPENVFNDRFVDKINKKGLQKIKSVI